MSCILRTDNLCHQAPGVARWSAGGVQLFTLGVIGGYLSRIKGRPLCVVEEDSNLQRDE